MNQQAPIDFNAEGVPSKPIHFLPCTINQSGPCPVSKFFIPQDKQVSFHGRGLHGQQLDLGLVVLERHEGALRVNAKSSEVHYWTYGDVPKSDDRVQQMLLFPALLAELHKPVMDF